MFRDADGVREKAPLDPEVCARMCRAWEAQRNKLRCDDPDQRGAACPRGWLCSRAATAHFSPALPSVMSPRVMADLPSQPGRAMGASVPMSQFLVINHMYV